jgi:hypothetical protein
MKTMNDWCDSLGVPSAAKDVRKCKQIVASAAVSLIVFVRSSMSVRPSFCACTNQVGTELWQMMLEGKPKQDPKTNALILKPDGTPEREYWHWGDMQVRADDGCEDPRETDVLAPARIGSW